MKMMTIGTFITFLDFLFNLFVDSHKMSKNKFHKQQTVKFVCLFYFNKKIAKKVSFFVYKQRNNNRKENFRRERLAKREVNK